MQPDAGVRNPQFQSNMCSFVDPIASKSIALLMNISLGNLTEEKSEQEFSFGCVPFNYTQSSVKHKLHLFSKMLSDKKMSPTKAILRQHHGKR